MQKLLFLFLGSFFMFFTACDRHQNDDINKSGMKAEGVVKAESENSVDRTIGQLQNALEANENISIVATIDHALNAQNAGLELRPTQVVLFGNSKLGTPLMKENQTVGLDLPQKITVYQKKNGEVVAAYTDPGYVAGRHGISGNEQVLSTISGALSKLTQKATANPEVDTDSSASAESGEGLVTVASETSIDETYQNLVQAIQENEALSIMAELDHQANASRVGMDLRPTKLLVFGNPNLGTPLMQNSQSLSLNLPQKMLVYEEADGQVFIAYNDPHYLADRHRVEGQEEVLDKISNALKNMAEGAAG